MAGAPVAAPADWVAPIPDAPAKVTTVSSTFLVPDAPLAVTVRLVPLVCAHHTSALPGRVLARPARVQVRPPPATAAENPLPDPGESAATNATASARVVLTTDVDTGDGAKALLNRSTDTAPPPAAVVVVVAAIVVVVGTGEQNASNDDGPFG